ncbi:MAG: hypothetical protein ABWZ25_19470 [Chitinophagaceae bacterium]
MEEAAGESPMLMNKLMIIHILFAVLMTGCQSSQREKIKSPSDDNISHVLDTSQLPVKDTEIAIKKTRAEYTESVQLDTTINQKLLLENPPSLKKFYAKVETVDLVGKIRSSPVAVFSNTGNDEYLLAYQYEGNAQSSFSCFEIGYIKDLKGIDESKVNHSGEKSFRTESNLQLGLSLADIVKIKGNGFKKKRVNGETILNYRIDDFATSTFLKKYNMPGYFIELVSKEDKVVKIVFGFDYP